MLAVKILALAGVFALGVVAMTSLFPTQPAGFIVCLIWGGVIGTVAGRIFVSEGIL